jgi:hypothetical protein
MDPELGLEGRSMPCAPVSLALCGFCLERYKKRRGSVPPTAGSPSPPASVHKPLERPIAPLVATASAGRVGERPQYSQLTWASVRERPLSQLGSVRFSIGMAQEIVTSMEMTELGQLRPSRPSPEPIELEEVGPSVRKHRNGNSSGDMRSRLGQSSGMSPERVTPSR